MNLSGIFGKLFGDDQMIFKGVLGKVMRGGAGGAAPAPVGDQHGALVARQTAPAPAAPNLEHIRRIREMLTRNLLRHRNNL